MKYHEFKKKLKQDVTQDLRNAGRNVDVSIIQFPRSSGTSYEGLQIRIDDDNMAPVFNLEEFYGDIYRLRRITYTDVRKAVVDYCLHQPESAPSEELFQLEEMPYEYIRMLLAVDLMGCDRNPKLLANCPHRKYEDLALFCRIIIDQDDGSCYSTVVTNELLETFGVTEEKLFEDALTQSSLFRPIKLNPLTDELSPDQSDPHIPHIHGSCSSEPYLLTNQKKFHGACSLFYPDVLELCAGIVAPQFYILPSSIHELILIPDEPDIDISNLKKIVKEVNEEIVSPEEKLTDSVYHFDWMTREFCLV